MRMTNQSDSLFFNNTLLNQLIQENYAVSQMPDLLEPNTVQSLSTIQNVVTLMQCQSFLKYRL